MLLLMTPEKKDSISLTMQSIGRRYVQYINKKHCRTGTLWESRHKSSIVDEDNYLLTCMRYIELNPVRANMVDHPSNYKWSSFKCNALGDNNKLVKQHPVYLALGANLDIRLTNYRGLFDSQIDDKDIKLIRNAALFSMPTGNNRFKTKIEQAFERKLGCAKRGRPLKLKNSSR